MGNRCGYCNKEITNFKVKSKVNNSYIYVCSVECDKKFKRDISYRQGKAEFRIYLFFQIIFLIGGILVVTESLVNALIVTIGAIASMIFLVKNNKKITVSDIKKVGLKSIIKEKNIMSIVICSLMILSIYLIARTFKII